jgi:hypothetical protein
MKKEKKEGCCTLLRFMDSHLPTTQYRTWILTIWRPKVVVENNQIVVVHIPDFHLEFFDTTASVDSTVGYRNLNSNDLPLCMSLLSQ